MRFANAEAIAATLIVKHVTHAILVLILIAEFPLEGFQNAKLSQQQIEQLIAIGTPDVVITAEIRDRGLDFAPTQKTVDDLQQRGAGEQTLTTVRELIRRGTLEIQAPPRSEVLVDGGQAGSADAEGVLVLRDLPAGVHYLIVRKPGYREKRFTVEIANREYKQYPVQLESVTGLLTIRVHPPASLIVIDGVGQFNDGVAALPCPPGTYSVTATHAGMQPEKQTITVAAGQHALAELHLTPDPDLFKHRLADATTALAGGNTTSAITAANEVLSLDPDNQEAKGIIAGAYLQAQDLQHFRTSAKEVLHSGGPVRIGLLHLHSFPRKSLHPVILTIAATTIAFDPQPSYGRCNTPAFAAPLRKIQAIETKRNDTGEVLLLVKMVDPNSSSTTTSKVVTLNFAASGSSVVAMPGLVLSIGNAGYQIESPSIARETLEAVGDLIRQKFQESR